MALVSAISSCGRSMSECYLFSTRAAGRQSLDLTNTQTRSFDLEQRALDTRWEADNADSIAGALGPRYRKPKMWTASIKPERVPTGEFSAGRQYAQRWRLPAAVQTGTAEGDLVSAIGASSASGSAAPASEEDIDDMELMNSILGTPSAPSA
jgi:hypothetical protein